MALLGDTFALAQAGRASMTSYFSLLAALPKIQDESRAKLFTMAFMALSFLDQAMAGTPAQASVRLAGRALFAPALSAVGWKPSADEGSEVTRLREMIIEMLAQFDDRGVVETAESFFDADVAGTSRLPPSIRSAVVQAVGYHADRARFDRLASLLESSSGEEDRQMYARALAGNRDPDRARAFLALSLSGSLPPNLSADIPGLVGALSPNGALAYEFTLEHWAELARLAGDGLGGRTSLLPMSAWRFNDSSWARRLVEDQQAKAGPEGASAAGRVASRIELRALVKLRHAETLETYLAIWSPRR
jgi:aminopeptidase N